MFPEEPGLEGLSTCLFFGTFNPVHQGHLMMAQSVLDQFSQSHGIHSVTFIPAARPPHRETDPDLASFRHRLKMVALATADHPGFRVSDVEQSLDGPSYTIRTIEALAPDPAVRVPMIIGSDALARLQSWHRPQDLVRRVLFLQAPRPDYPWVDVLPFPDGPVSLATERIQMPPLAVSSTEIRRKLAEGLPHPGSLRYMLPPDVRRFILENRLYRP